MSEEKTETYNSVISDDNPSADSVKELKRGLQSMLDVFMGEDAHDVWARLQQAEQELEEAQEKEREEAEKQKEAEKEEQLLKEEESKENRKTASHQDENDSLNSDRQTASSEKAPRLLSILRQTGTDITQGDPATPIRAPRTDFHGI